MPSIYTYIRIILGYVIKDFEKEDTSALLTKPEVEIKVEENDNITNYPSDVDNDITSDYLVKGEGSELRKYDNHNEDNNLDFDLNIDNSSGKENVKNTKLKKKRKQRTLKDKLPKADGDKTKFTCALCSREFISEYHLKKHTDASHSVFSCEECKIEFNNRKDLKLHTKSLHKDNTQNFVCQVSFLSTL